VPAAALVSLSTDAPLTPSTLADRAVRGLTPAVLERLGTDEAARIRALGAITGSDTARATMPALERIARATGAPADPFRAASQCAGALLRVESPGGEAPGSIQLVAAVTRLVNAAVRAGLPAADAVALLSR
jgi:ClpP class serine protease